MFWFVKKSFIWLVRLVGLVIVSMYLLGFYNLITGAQIREDDPISYPGAVLVGAVTVVLLTIRCGARHFRSARQ